MKHPSIALQLRPFGRTGVMVSALGFGGSKIGFTHTSLPDVVRLLSAALEAGINVVDTAASYAGSEVLIGDALQQMGVGRERVLLFSKCGGPDLADDGWTAGMVRASVDDSLRRLRTDHLDLLQLHTCSAGVIRDGRVIDALDAERAAGRVRLIGYSGDGEGARAAVDSARLDVLQTSVSLADQEAIAFAIPAAAQRGMGVIAKRPLAGAAWRTGLVPSGASATYASRFERLAYPFLASATGDAVGKALRFSLSVPGVSVAILASTDPDQWAENARNVAAGALAREEYDTIRRHWADVARADWIGQV